MKPERVIIKKYGNRRLYNTSASRYINLDDLAELVRNGNEVQVVDAKSGDDLTRVTLMQVIVEDAKDQPSGLPLELLKQMIVASNHVGREFLMWYLKSAFETYHKIQGALQNPVSDAAFSPLQMMKNFMGAPAGAQPSDDLQALKRRIAELEAQKKRAPRKKPAGKKRGRSKAAAR
jgi:polyhydroxyalkanoate synthesis repressor PhaR